MNLHDQKVLDVDRSGQSHDQGTLLRRMDCFSNFVGNTARGKNISLFYCFVIWEGNNMRWGTRRLGYALGVSSVGAASTSMVSPPHTSVLNKRQRDQAMIMTQVINDFFSTSTFILMLQHFSGTTRSCTK